MKMACRIMDARFVGFAVGDEPPRIAPVSCRYKWMPWRKRRHLWAVVQPRREFIGPCTEWVWRPVSIFTHKIDAANFLREMD